MYFRMLSHLKSASDEKTVQRRPEEPIAISPGQRPGSIDNEKLRPVGAKAVSPSGGRLEGGLLLPLQGVIGNVHIPRALPWAMSSLALQTIIPPFPYNSIKTDAVTGFVTKRFFKVKKLNFVIR